MIYLESKIHISILIIPVIENIRYLIKKWIIFINEMKLLYAKKKYANKRYKFDNAYTFVY